MPAQAGTMDAADTYNAKWVAWLSLGQLISWGSVLYTFTQIMGPVERTLGLSRVESSLAFSLGLLAEGLMAYPVGRWIDQGHERIVMTCGSLLAGLCLFAHGWIDGKVGLYAVWIGLGLAMAAVLYSPVFAVVTRRFPHDFRRAIITLTFLGGLASTVFIPLTAWLIAALGWREALMVLAALHIFVCAPLHAHALRNAPRPRSTPVDAPASSRSGLARHVFSAAFLLIGVFVVLMMSVTVALSAHMVSLLREHGLSEAWVVAIPASIGAIQVLGRVLLFLFERNFDVHLANRLIPCLIPLGLIALLLAPWAGNAQVALVIAFVVLWGLGNGMLTIVKGTAIAEYVDREHVASLNGALGLPLALARSAAPLGLGVLWSSHSGYALGLGVFLGLSMLGVVALVGAQRFSLLR